MNTHQIKKASVVALGAVLISLSAAPHAVAGEPAAGCPTPYELTEVSATRPAGTRLDAGGNQDGWFCSKPHPGNVENQPGNVIENRVQNQ